MADSIAVLKKDECFGCRSCEQTCPKKCISILPDEEGFFYPQVAENSCVRCGVCAGHCPSVQKIGKKQSLAFLGVCLKDKVELEESASGGVFAALADYILEQGGAVFGAAYDGNQRVRHCKAESKAELQALKKSKYVASDTERTYSEVAELLRKEPNRLVLYTGSPCQIHGLYSFLGEKPQNLFTADIVCHGVPSQKLFDKYIAWLSEKQRGKIIYYGFRDKDVAGWSCGGKTKTKTKTKTKVINGSVDPYYSSFMRGETYRLSCYRCPFASVEHRPGDITMGDFWGIEFAHPEFYSKNGVSCCMVNTEKGGVLFKRIRHRLECIETTAEKITAMNGNLLRPTAKPAVRDSVYVGIDELPASKFIPRLYAPPYKRLIRLVISKIPHGVKTWVKKVVYGL